MSELPSLPGEQKDNPPALPGTEPVPPCTVPEFWANRQRVIGLVFTIAAAGTLQAQKDAGALWSEYRQLAG